MWVGKPGRSVAGFPAVSSVGRSTVTDIVDRDDFLLRVDLIHDPVVAYANSVQSVGPGQFHGLTREGIFAKTPGSVQDASNRILADPTEILLHGGLEHDPIGRHVASAAV